MPPNSKRMYINGPGSRRAPKGFLGSTYETLTSSENAAAVRSIAIFGAAVAFLASPWGEMLLPPYVEPKRNPWSIYADLDLLNRQ
ncbi:hypothetical protein HRG_000080 [Hirsutella rhossiliensis]|uniref:Uncharacterized protein n=1 Tax=Hirsutella rhossiliensis TaxID=111463 RepID=A0A9P8N4F2_9HYPO|nr:uncharacterized protein HRG_00080 [Hirsutella rhossiliensis]KAH0967438.1 hypothetical protein HRG_00080 [Hirsutella rhossiliensis]